MSEISQLRRLTLRRWFYSDEGAGFMAQSPTPGTGIAGAVVASFSATAAYLTLFNNNPAPTIPGGGGPVNPINPKRIYLDYIRLIVTAAGASATSAQAVANIDTGNRYASGGSAITPWSNLLDPAQGAVQTSNAVINVGAVVASAATGNVREVGRSVMRSTILQVNDEILFHFGEDGVSQGGSNISAAAATKIDVFMNAVTIGPQCTFLLQPYLPANAVTPPSFEIELGYAER